MKAISFLLIITIWHVSEIKFIHGVSDEELKELKLSDEQLAKAKRVKIVGEEKKTSHVHITRAEKKSEFINVGITFTKVTENEDLQKKFKLCVNSLLKYSTVNINFYIIGDKQSQLKAKEIFKSIRQPKIEYNIVSLDAEDLAKKMHQMVVKMQDHFSYSSNSYYGDALFFLSIGLFKILDPAVDKIILLDSDLKFKNDIGELYRLFDNFNDTNIIGIARDGQPVYRHLFWQYRNENKNTRVGDPPPDGLTGFNSGVLLMHLDKMRKSKLYQQMMEPEQVEALTKKYYFKGHLGDQDFFTLIGMEHQELFYVLPCNWNRQLCKWWGEHGYEDVFDLYFKCDGPVSIFHGNCNTEIPKDTDDEEYESYGKHQEL